MPELNYEFDNDPTAMFGQEEAEGYAEYLEQQQMAGDQF